MSAANAVFLDLAYIFFSAIAGGLLAWRLRIPVIIGYILGGIAVSPFTPGPSVNQSQIIEIFAEIGVILLLFSIGLEFSVSELLKAKWVALAGGPLGIVLLFALSFASGSLLGWSRAQSLVVGAAVCVASTMVLTRFLLELGLLRSEAGRVMVAITLMEDLVMVVLIVLVPDFGKLRPGEFLVVLRGLGRAALILAPVFLVAAKIVPPLLRRVARTQKSEFFFIVILALCLGTAALSGLAGLSPAFGAFSAGLMISGSDYAHEALAQLFPVRDAFVALFFVTIGMLVEPRALFANLPLLSVFLALIIVAKLGVWTLVVRLFRYSLSTAVTVAAGLTQIGEFSFILVQAARGAGLVGAGVYNATLAASLITILLNSLLLRGIPPLIARFQNAARRPQALSLAQAARLRDHVILCGFGRVGGFIGAALDNFGIRYTVIDTDPDVHSAARSRGIPSLFGDPARPHILETAGAAAASLVIITIPAADRARLAVENIRALNPGVPVLARSHRRADNEMLAAAGATEVIQPELEAAATMIRHASHYLRIPDDQVRLYLRGFRKAMYSLHPSPGISGPAIPEIRQITLRDPSLAGKTLRQSQIRERFGLTILSILRSSGEELMNPSPETLLLPGDALRLFGLPGELDAFSAAQPRLDSPSPS